MTLLKIEVKTVTGKYHPEDMIKIWAPALRANGEAVVSTAPEIVKLVQGKAQVELLPGPARIQIMCGGTLDNAVRKVTIPDATNATLRAVLEEGFDWEPEIVTEVMRYRNEAVAASTSAADSASAAASSATVANNSRSSAASSATAASQSAASASTSATNAATSATSAATSAGEAATSEDTSLDAAAAAIAAAVSVAQFQGHGFPNGQVTAPVGSIYTDLDATAGAIRWIKTSGTGNTGWKVEYGDTGWRALVEWDSNEEIITGAIPGNLDGKIAPTPGQEGGIYLRREGNTIHGTVAGATSYSDSNVYIPLPAGLRHAIGQQRTYYRTKYHASNTQAAYILLSGRSALYLLQLDVGGPVAGSTYTYNASTFSYPAEAEWPSIMSWNPPRHADNLP